MIFSGNLRIKFLVIFALTSSSSSTPLISIDLSSKPLNGPLSQLAFGANGALGKVTPDPQVPYPLLRWGGNAATRYNPFYDVMNHASDWFFLNEAGPGDTDIAWLNSLADQDTTGLLTVTTIGWLACSGGVYGQECAQKAPGFSVKKYGNQTKTECSATGNPSWCDADAGNGILSNSTPVTGNNPFDTSVRSENASFALAWLDRLASLPSFKNLRGVMLDNEPDLWFFTHRDVHPEPTTYNELWSSIVTFAAPIRAAYPHLEIHGLQSWGWCAYFNSAVQDSNDCKEGSDRRSHGDVPLLQWLVQQLAAYQAEHGVLLLTHLDVHAYPQATGVTSDIEDEKTGALRLRSTGMWADPNYIDESWINETVMLLPRLRAWVDAANATSLGLKYSISEFNFGSDKLVTAGVAHAETLAIFAQEGVDEAAVWGAPTPNSPSAQAWALFLNYDGQGASVTGSPLETISSSPTQVTAYSFLQEGSRSLLNVILIGKTLPSVGPVDIMLNVTWPSGTPTGNATGKLYGFSASSPMLRFLSTVYVTCGSMNTQLTNLTLNPWSATLMVLDTLSCK
jgi:hypothetical protein